MRFRKAAVSAAFLSVMAAPAAAQSGWTMIGHTAIAGDAGTGTISPAWQAQFREIMFCVEDHGVRLSEATVRFRDGRAQNVRIRARIADGGCSRAASVGRNRDIEAVDVGYDPASLEGGRARVELFGR